MSREVWFQLVDGQGNPIGSGSAGCVDLAEDAKTFRLLHAVKILFSDSHLVGIAPTDLVVFANRAAYDTKQALEEDSPIGSLGGSKQAALIVQVPVQRRAEMDEEPALKRLKQSTVITYEHMNSIERNLDIRTWQIGGISLEICSIEPDFPEWFYVRKETLDIIKVFEDEMERNYTILFVGSPGVGKSMLVVLFAFYLALIQKKRVFLLRKVKRKGFSMLHLDVVKQQCWRMEEATFEDIRLLRQFWKGAVLCLDGLLEEDVSFLFDILAPFRMLATSAQFKIRNDDLLLDECLVPFWSFSDLQLIGAHREWPKQEIKERYFYSGGNLRDFTSLKKKSTFCAAKSVDRAIGEVNVDGAKLLNTQVGTLSDQQFDRIRMTGLNASGERDTGGEFLVKYQNRKDWVYVITSEYALRQLGNIVMPKYYEELYSKGRMLGDDGLMGIAFENYVHTMARDRNKIELRMRAYDRQQVREHTYVALELEAKSFCNDGKTATECDEVIKRFARSTDDYWYPSCRYLKSIDSIAKLSMDGQFDTIGLIQITISATHKINSNGVDRYATFFPNGSNYIALVPDKETCDKFRLAPANPTTKVPLKVAYITNWRV